MRKYLEHIKLLNNKNYFVCFCGTFFAAVQNKNFNPKTDFYYYGRKTPVIAANKVKFLEN